jgi:hypothetical protein
MEVLDRGLQLQSGETGVTFGLRALNASQDHLESLLALQPNVMGSTIATVTTTADTESTTFPTGLLRIDRLQYIDSGTSRPAWDLERVGPVGDHYTSGGVYTSSTTTGKPVRYFTNGTKIFWDPLPSATHTVRYYGLVAASDITAAGTFGYPDVVLLPIATFASKLLRVGKDDDQLPITQVGMETFAPVIQAMTRFNRDRAPGYDYRYSHTE